MAHAEFNQRQLLKALFIEVWAAGREALGDSENLPMPVAPHTNLWVLGVTAESSYKAQRGPLGCGRCI